MSEIIHIWSDYDRNNDDHRRHEIAKATWPDWVEVPIHDSALRRSGLQVGASRRVPFIKDLINHIEAVIPEHIIVLTNSDTCVAKVVCEKLAMIVPKRAAIWSARRDFPMLAGPIDNATIPKGEKHPGADLFAFTLHWWLEYRNSLPDFIYAYEGWDLGLKTLITETGGCEVLYLCYHEHHQSHWFDPKYRECSGNLYNRDLLTVWIKDHPYQLAETMK